MRGIYRAPEKFCGTMLFVERIVARMLHVLLRCRDGVFLVSVKYEFPPFAVSPNMRSRTFLLSVSIV